MHRVALFVLVALFAASCASTPHAPERAHREAPAVAVRVVPAAELASPLGEEVVGTVRARTSAAIASSVMGRVREVKVELGSRVKRGDVLVRISAAEIGAQVEQARAVLAEAELNRDRMRQLASSNAVASSQVDAAEARYGVAAATLAEAQVMRGYTVLRAPIDGVITAKQAEVGDLATPGRPLLVLESPGAMRVEAYVPETLAHGIEAGATLPVRIDALDRTIEGTVAELAPSADAASRSLLVKLDLPADPALRAGMFGRVLVRTGEEHVVSVPRAALVRRGQIEIVFVSDGERARLRIVRTGRTHGETVEILSGLAEGEPVIVSHPERLTDGRSIEVQP